MKITLKIFAVIAVISALMLLALQLFQAQAQSFDQSPATPRIEGFNVDEVRRLTPRDGAQFQSLRHAWRRGEFAY